MERSQCLEKKWKKKRKQCHNGRHIERKMSEHDQKAPLAIEEKTTKNGTGKRNNPIQ